MSIAQIERYKIFPVWHKGKTLPQLSGENANHWKGGVTSVVHLLRTNPKWRMWREAVFKRDGYKCFDCGESGYLHPHHIIPIKSDRTKVYELNNGITLCRQCHLKTFGKELKLARTYFSFVQALV